MQLVELGSRLGSGSVSAASCSGAILIAVGVPSRSGDLTPNSASDEPLVGKPVHPKPCPGGTASMLGAGPAHLIAALLGAIGRVGSGGCWVARAGEHFYASNAASASISNFQSGQGGPLLTLLGNTNTDPGTVDATVSGDSRFLYVQTGGTGVVDEFAIGAQGALSKIGAITVPGALGGEGIVAL
jgi:hypothetical protein